MQYDIKINREIPSHSFRKKKICIKPPPTCHTMETSHHFILREARKRYAEPKHTREKPLFFEKGRKNMKNGRKILHKGIDKALNFCYNMRCEWGIAKR